MFRIVSSPLAALLALAVLATGCASAPKASGTAARSASVDCHQLATEIGRTEADRRIAENQQQNAWKLVVPVAVAVRYADGNADVREADHELARLRADYARKGCDGHAR